MIRTEDPNLVGQQFLCSAGSGCHIPYRSPPVGNLIAGGEGVRMVKALDAQPVDEQPLICGESACHITHLPSPESNLVLAGKAVGMVSAQILARRVCQTFEVRDRGLDLATLSKTAASAEQYRVGTVLPQATDAPEVPPLIWTA
ncbi:hypothetical protein [Kitasatospora sp. NBC_01266]|uniref:hypothetical protein n=1 Tax=Kitasatospora sp. NBC_01266 TaxID=2903572 RepID=UPI002E34DF60|nr:hypothetical protein [Kitasatospora sp. NBC_01266]